VARAERYAEEEHIQLKTMFELSNLWMVRHALMDMQA